MDWNTETPPTGWLEEDGSSLLRVGTYAWLYAVIGTRYGAVDGAHFNLPDRRGRFKRAWDHGAGNDPDAAARTAQGAGGASGDHVGSMQGWQVQGHSHDVRMDGGGVNYNGSGPNPVAQRTGATGVWFTAAFGGNQTNPINSATMSIIKVLP